MLAFGFLMLCIIGMGIAGWISRKGPGISGF